MRPLKASWGQALSNLRLYVGVEVDLGEREGAGKEWVKVQEDPHQEWASPT